MKNKEGLINGLAAGGLTVGFFLLFYFTDRALILNPWVWWGSLVIYLVFMFRTVRRTTASSFRESLSSAFLTFVVANALFYLFYYLLFSVFDPGLVDLQREILADHPMWQDNNSRADLSVTIGRTLFSFVYSLLGGFLLALGVGYVARK
jgi:hypothetical protein